MSDAAKSWETQIEWVMAMHEMDREGLFGAAEICLAGHEVWVPLDVLVAESLRQRAEGMQGATFDEWDGMLFLYHHPMVVQFHMNQVPEAIGLATFGRDGEPLEWREMDPGASNTEPLTKPFMFALEMPLVKARDLGLNTRDLSLVPPRDRAVAARVKKGQKKPNKMPKWH